MFITKLVNSNATTTSKPPKINNVPINVVAVITIRSQQLTHQMFKERESIKAKGVKDWH
jgi:hypothetical protein